MARGGHLESVDGPDSPKRKPQRTRTSFQLPTAWKEWLDEESARQHTSMAAVILKALAEYRGANSRSTWDVDDGTELYDPAHFYTASQDKHGHSFHLRVNIPKPLAGEMGSLVQRGEIPAYRTMEDIARDAIVHRVKKLSHMLDDGELETVVDMAMMAAEEQRMIDIEEEADTLLGLIRTNVTRLRGRGRDQALALYLKNREDQAEYFPEPWKGELLALVEDEWRKLGGKRKNRTRYGDGEE